MYIVYCTVYCVLCIVCCILCTVCYALCAVSCILCIVYCALYAVYCIQYTVYCLSYIVDSILCAYCFGFLKVLFIICFGFRRHRDGVMVPQRVAQGGPSSDARCGARAYMFIRRFGGVCRSPYRISRGCRRAAILQFSFLGVADPGVPARGYRGAAAPPHGKLTCSCLV